MFGRWIGRELRAGDLTSHLCPARFRTRVPRRLADDTSVTYAISTEHASDAARGARFDDPRLAIDWPFAPIVIAEKDRAYPHLEGP